MANLVGRKVRNNVGTFITFNVGDKVGNYPLTKHYMILPKGINPNDVVDKFAWEYPLDILNDMKNDYVMHNFNYDDYMAVKRNMVK